MTKQAIDILIKEALYGKPEGAPGTMFAEDGEAILQLAKNTTAQQASTAPAEGVSTMAAHVIHAAYYFWFAIEYMESRTPKADWDASWAKQTVNENEWQTELHNLETKANRFLELLPDMDLDEEMYCVGAIGTACHLAYHLGAIRQIHQMVKSDE